MKKVYLSLFAVAIASATTAQIDESAVRTPQKAGPDFSAPKGKQGPGLTEEKILNVLWTDDFSGGTNPLETAEGTYTLEGPDGAYWQLTASTAHPTNFTGFVNAMTGEHLSWNSYTPNANEPNFATTPVMGAIISPSIALTGNTNSIGISFNTDAMYCCNFNEEVIPWGISISTDDGTTWSDTVRFDFLGVDRNESTQDFVNPLAIAVNLDAIAPAGPQAQFRFKFIWDGDSPDGNGQYNTHYYWLIDDVSIYEIPSNDIALTAGYHNDIVFDYEYSYLTVEQSSAREMVPVLFVENQGIDDQTVDFTVEISDGGGVVNTTVVTETILAGEVDTIYFNTGYMPSAADTYTTSFSIPADDDPTDDTYNASDLVVNANLMAHDYGADEDYGWDPNGNNSDLSDEPHSFGNVYYPSADQEVYGLDVAFGPNMSDGLFLLARIQEMTGTSIQDPLNPVAEIDHVVAAGEEGSVVTIVFAQPVTLTAGTGYIVDIFKADGTTGQEFDISGSQAAGEDDDFGSANYGPYGTGGAINYWTGWGYASYVRPNFDMSLSVAEGATLEGVSIYPNPSEGIINITNDSNLEHTIEVRNLAGQLVSTTTVSNATSIDISSEAAGVYIVKVSNENGATAEKITLK